MIALFVLGALAAILLLLGVLPISVDLAWREGSFSNDIRIWFYAIEGSGQIPVGEILELLWEDGLPLLKQALRRIHIDRLRVYFTSAFSDPATTAMAYSMAGTAMQGLLEAAGDRITHAELRADVDFDAQTPTLDFRLKLSIRVYQAVYVVLRYGLTALKHFLALMKQYKPERTAEHGESSDRRNDAAGDGKDPHYG